MADALPGSKTPPRRRPGARSRRSRWVGGGGLLLAVLLLLAGWWLLDNVLPYSILCPSRAERWEVYHNCTPADFGLRAEDMWVETAPGVWLRGWHVESAAGSSSPRRTIVLLHGSSSCKEAELRLAKLFAEHGFDCLLYDSRAHGESGGKYRTFGYYERDDFSRFVDAAERRFGSLGPLAVYGNSMGAAIALQTMAVEPRIRCGVVESSFATLREIVHDYMEHYSGLPFFFLSNLVLDRAGRLAHFDVDAVNPEAAAGRLRQPVLLAHGTDDHWIAFRYGERIARQLQAPGSVWHPVAGADHGDIWKVGGDAYQQLVLNFLETHCR